LCVDPPFQVHVTFPPLAREPFEGLKLLSFTLTPIVGAGGGGGSGGGGGGGGTAGGLGGGGGE